MSNKSITALKKAKKRIETSLAKFNKIADSIEADLSGALDVVNDAIAAEEKSGDAPAKPAASRSRAKPAAPAAASSKKPVAKKPATKYAADAKRPRKPAAATKRSKPVSEDAE